MGLSTIKNIPAIMRAKGWNSGAALMDKWFAGPAAIAPAYTAPDLTTIKMAWALGFQRAKAVFDAMINEKVWSNDKAKVQIKTIFSSEGMLGSNQRSFDFSTRPVQAQHRIHVNHRPVSAGLFDAVDDMEAALGNFSLYVVPLAGDVGPLGQPGRFQVKFTKIGFHIMDSYDFNGDQDLGHWDESSNNVGKTIIGAPHGEKVTNESFRNWRAANNAGGDFLVYSDVQSVALVDSFFL
jgi:hypothetical protein